MMILKTSRASCGSFVFPLPQLMLTIMRQKCYNLFIESWVLIGSFFPKDNSPLHWITTIHFEWWWLLLHCWTILPHDLTCCKVLLLIQQVFPYQYYLQLKLKTEREKTIQLDQNYLFSDGKDDQEILSYLEQKVLQSG